jgi:hypothetical protein
LLAWYKFSSHPSKNDKYLSIQLEAGQIWTTGALSFAHIFFQKSFLGTQASISSEIHK